jgi:hypothetical protein
MSQTSPENKFVNFIKTKRMADFKQQLDEIYDYVVSTSTAAEKATATLQEWNKDSEIQKLQQEIRELKAKLYNDFTLSVEEHVEITKWQQEHMSVQHKNKSYGHWSFEFTPTSLGLIGTCKCGICGEEFMFREP